MQRQKTLKPKIGFQQNIIFYLFLIFFWFWGEKWVEHVVDGFHNIQNCFFDEMDDEELMCVSSFAVMKWLQTLIVVQ